MEDLPWTKIVNRLAGESQPVTSQGGSQPHFDAVDRLYSQLRRLASEALTTQADPETKHPTELVSATFEELFRSRERPWFDRYQFFEQAARAMRRLVVQRSRERFAAQEISVDLNEIDAVASEREQELIDLDEALAELEKVEPRYARVIELRYFARLSVPEVAEVLRVSKSTVEREWRFARAWLMRRMNRS